MNWEINGITGAGDKPPCVGQFQGTLIILGGSRGVWEDYEPLRNMQVDIMAVNEVGLYFPNDIRHWTSLHNDCFDCWLRMKVQGPAILTHCQQPGPGIAVMWNITNEFAYSGLSGLFSCYIGLALGYTQIILAGMPMDYSGHFYDPPWYLTERHNYETESILDKWNKSLDVFNGRVKSMSGNTARILGKPNGLSS